MTQSRKDGPVLVAGGGIGGLTAAVALRRAGFDVQVFERAPEIREIGAGIAISPNAVIALRRLGLDQKVIDAGVVAETLDLRSADGTLLASLSPGGLGAGIDAPFVCIHRATLQAVLLEAAGREGVHTGCECVGFEEGPVLRLRDGRRIEGAVIVGADGLHSRIREQLLGDGEPLYAGYMAWRAATPENFVPRPTTTSETWGRGHRFGIVPLDHGRVYWYATANVPPGGRAGRRLGGSQIFGDDERSARPPRVRREPGPRAVTSCPFIGDPPEWKCYGVSGNPRCSARIVNTVAKAPSRPDVGARLLNSDMANTTTPTAAMIRTTSVLSQKSVRKPS